MEALRFQVVGEAFKKKPLDVKTPSERPAQYFGKKVFNREKMYKYLPKDVYEKMRWTMVHASTVRLLTQWLPA